MVKQRDVGRVWEGEGSEGNGSRRGARRLRGRKRLEWNMEGTKGR